MMKYAKIKGLVAVVTVGLTACGNEPTGSSTTASMYRTAKVLSGAGQITTLAMGKDTVFASGTSTYEGLLPEIDGASAASKEVVIDGDVLTIEEATDVDVKGDWMAGIDQNTVYLYDLSKKGALTTSIKIGSDKRPADLAEVTFSPDGRCVYVMDAGNDKIHCYGISSDRSELYPLRRPSVNLRPGCNAVDIDWHPDGLRWYTLCQDANLILAGSVRDSTGLLQMRSTLQSAPIGVEGNATTDMCISEDGRFLYVANRDLATIGVYTLDQDMSFSFLQFLDLNDKGDYLLASVDNALLIGQQATGKIYKAVHQMDQKIKIIDSVQVDKLTAIATTL